MALRELNTLPEHLQLRRYFSGITLNLIKLDIALSSYMEKE